MRHHHGPLYLASLFSLFSFFFCSLHFTSTSLPPLLPPCSKLQQSSLLLRHIPANQHLLSFQPSPTDQHSRFQLTPNGQVDQQENVVSLFNIHNLLLPPSEEPRSPHPPCCRNLLLSRIDFPIPRLIRRLHRRGRASPVGPL